MGIFHMQAYFCNLDTWSDKERKELYKYSGSEPSGSGVELDIDKMCPENLFVVGAQVQASRRQDGENDPRGLVGLRFWCNSIERQKERIDPQEIEAKWFNDNQNLFDTGLISNPDIDSSYISGASTQNGIADFDNGAGCTEDKGATGVIGLKFETTEVILGATVSHDNSMKLHRNPFIVHTLVLTSSSLYPKSTTFLGIRFCGKMHREIRFLFLLIPSLETSHGTT